MFKCSIIRSIYRTDVVGIQKNAYGCLVLVCQNTYMSPAKSRSPSRTPDHDGVGHHGWRVQYAANNSNTYNMCIHEMHT